MQNNKTELFKKVAHYYSAKLAQHGETPKGVDWNGEESQTLRFEQLCRIISGPGAFSLNDLGCGYGALFDFLTDKYAISSYLGVDVSDDMVRAARQRYDRHPKARFIRSTEPDRIADYSVASGIFNVRLMCNDDEWFEYIQSALDVLDRFSRHGFAFNCLTSYSDENKMQDYLYYADPCRLFDRCKRMYSRQVALLHDYGLYEFTILVRKKS